MAVYGLVSWCKSSLKIKKIIWIPMITDGTTVGVRGGHVTLRCPVDTPGEIFIFSTKRWFKVIAPNNDTGSDKLKLVCLTEKQGHSRVPQNKTCGVDILISSTEGDLTIRHLTLKDAGLYKCQFTGSSDKYIHLIVQGMLFYHNQFLNQEIIADDTDSVSGSVLDNDMIGWFIDYGLIMMSFNTCIASENWDSIGSGNDYPPGPNDVWTVDDWILGINFSKTLHNFEPFHWKINAFGNVAYNSLQFCLYPNNV